MIEPTPYSHPFTPAALAATQVGTWEYDVAQDRLRCDATMCALYGLSPEEGEAGVPIGRIRATIHPDDRPRGIAKYECMLRAGGLFVIEYRTLPARDDIRWVLVRGSYETDASGEVVIGRGIAIDMTESRREGYVEGQAHFVIGSEAAAHPLDDLADLTLRVRRAVDALGAPGWDLRPLVDALLFGIGRRLAARLCGERDDGHASPGRPPRH